MNYLNGGYAMLKHNATQTELANAYKTKKPILLYDENGFAYWARINETTSIVDDEIIYTYDVVKINQIENLVDSAGNSRFIEGNCNVNASLPSGIEINYAKWSLSGSHLMIVIAGNVANGTTIPQAQIASVNVPDWVKNKIIPIWAQYYVDSKLITLRGDDWSTQNINVVLYKDANNLIGMNWANSNVLDKDRAFRIQFDLLIDADYSE